MDHDRDRDNDRVRDEDYYYDLNPHGNDYPEIVYEYNEGHPGGQSNPYNPYAGTGEYGLPPEYVPNLHLQVINLFELAVYLLRGKPNTF